MTPRRSRWRLLWEVKEVTVVVALTLLMLLALVAVGWIWLIQAPKRRTIAGYSTRRLVGGRRYHRWNITE
jgi:hypothetical protein